MFERYTEAARRSLFFARYATSEIGATVIETEHVLLGLRLQDARDRIRELSSSASPADAPTQPDAPRGDRAEMLYAIQRIEKMVGDLTAMIPNNQQKSERAAAISLELDLLREKITRG